MSAPLQMQHPAGQVRLRDVLERDLATFFTQQLDPESNRMAAFTARDPADQPAFLSHWLRVLANPNLRKQTILYSEPGSASSQIAGYLVAFDLLGQFSVGYWIGKEFWGRGIATRALSAFVEQIPTRPLYARAAKDNAASLRVLEKCGFQIIAEDRGFAYARGAEIEEWLLRLE